MESRTYLQNLPYFDRLDYVAPMNQEHAWCLAVEKLLGVEVPRRGQLIRVLYSEIGRILNAPAERHHAGDGRGRADPAALGLRRAREADGVLRARLGARMHAAYFRPGGVHQDLPPDLIDDIETLGDPFPKVLDDIDGLLTENRIFKQRNVDIGVVTEEDARTGASPA
jgi:NADH-quinone oxidoreductase subunit D